MSIEDFVGSQRRLVKFVSLTVGVLMIGAAVTCMVYGRAWWLAVAAAVIGAWALLTCVEIIKDEFRDAVRKERIESESDTDEPAEASLDR